MAGLVSRSALAGHGHAHGGNPHHDPHTGHFASGGNSGPGSGGMVQTHPGITLYQHHGSEHAEAHRRAALAEEGLRHRGHSVGELRRALHRASGGNATFRAAVPRGDVPRLMAAHEYFHGSPLTIHAAHPHSPVVNVGGRGVGHLPGGKRAKVGTRVKAGARAKPSTSASAAPFVAGVPAPRAILRRALAELGLTLADHDRDAITPADRLKLLHLVRLVARAWLRREAERTCEALYPPEAAEIVKRCPAGIDDVALEADLYAATGTTGLTSKALLGAARKAAREFFDRAGRFLRSAIVAGSLAVLGPGTASRAELDAIDRNVAGQHEYLAAFERDVMDDRKPLLPARAELYGGSVWGAAQDVRREAIAANPLIVEEAARHLPEDTPCPDCRDRLALGRVPVGTLAPVGRSACMNSCHCIIIYYDVDGTEYLAGRGPLDEAAFGTRGLGPDASAALITKAYAALTYLESELDQNPDFPPNLARSLANTLGGLISKKPGGGMGGKPARAGGHAHGNPHHDALGHFSDHDAHAGGKPKPGKPGAKPGASAGASAKPKPSAGASAKPKPSSSAFHLPASRKDTDVKAAADKTEQYLAAKIGGRWEGGVDPKTGKYLPYDAHVPASKSPLKRDEYVEIKMRHNGEKSTMGVKDDALLRKVEHHGSAGPNAYHSVLVDVRDRAHGGAEAHRYSGHDLYYKRGVADYSLSKMYKVKDMAELKKLMSTPDHLLPPAARGEVPKDTPHLREKAVRVAEGRARRDAGGKKEERRERARAKLRAARTASAGASPS